ncbi:MAG: hypothetical protein IT384_01405 [Deltaproteobacteria bacterium]|nr:hypothetical protein [Deltaproteobacteria bacterium]
MQHPGLDLEDERPPRFTRNADDPAKLWLWAAAVIALAAAAFAGMSTADFIEHLDRQVHSIHCSLVPGASQQIGESGCRTVMMSPYSSLFRTSLWGGLPISLLAMAVFSYLVYRAVDFAMNTDRTRRETGFLIAAWLLPVLMSVIYGMIAATKIGATCKLCVGVYVTSALGFLCALIAHAKQEADLGGGSSASDYIRWFGEGTLFVAVLGALYLFGAPQTAKATEGCGHLVKKDDPSGVMVSLGGRGAKSIALLDPLCPACRGFDQRLEASGLRQQLDLTAVLFPLDQTCNWMVKTSLHPGACAVSEAILCSPERARQILDWAFAEQESLVAEAKADERKLRDRIGQRFPDVKGCLGSPKVKNKLNKSLRWAVANALPVLTPQLFIGERRVCDEDTDLGLEYTIASMLQQGAGGAK